MEINGLSMFPQSISLTPKDSQLPEDSQLPKGPISNLANPDPLQPEVRISRFAGVSTTVEQRIQHNEKTLQAMMMFINEVPRSAEPIVEKVEELNSFVEVMFPDIAQKEWDFSIDGNNEIVIFGDDLSKAEKEVLGAVVSELGFEEDLINLRENTVKAIQLERNAGGTSFYIGKYDITNENFSEIIRIRELSSDLTPPEKFSAQKQIPWKTMTEALANQLAARADETYLTNTDEIVLNIIDERV